jgi:drug/metabolite transporter (DMT)-like permease
VNRFALHPEIADVAMLAVVLMWAVNNILMKVTIATVPPEAYVVARFLLVMVFVWAWIAWRRIPAAIAPRDLPLLLLIGVVGVGVYNVLFAVGIEHTSAFSAALLLSLSPVFTLVLARASGLERPSAAQWLSVALTVIGGALFVSDKLRAEGFALSLAGDLLCLLAALGFAIYSLASLPLTNRYGATVTTAWAATIGLAAIAPWGLPVAARYPWQTLTPALGFALFYAAVISLLVGYTIWSWAIARGGVARTVPYLFLVPVVTGGISALFLGETFSPLKLAGAALVLAGTTLVRLLGRGIAIRRASATGEPAASTRVAVAQPGSSASRG